MAALELAIADLERELESLKGFAHGFLDADAPQKLDQFRGQLAPLLRAGGGPWAISKGEPIRTKPTNQYIGGHGELVWAAISCKWELRRINKTRHVRIDGIASTRIELFRRGTEGDESLGMWRIEIGDEASPGCYFHSQIMGQASTLPFPEWLTIPRLPTLMLTPASSIEFVLGELFQKEWARTTSQIRDEIVMWGAIQRHRIMSWLQWQTRVLDADAYGLLPWTRMKLAKPDLELVDATRGH